MWKAVRSLIKPAFPASSNDAGRGKSPVTLLDLPVELLIEILTLTLASDVPFDLQKFIELGKKDRDPRFPSDGSYSWFLRGLHPSQREHYLDWLAINGTSRSFRACGKELFFSKKVFIVTPSLLKALLDGSCKNISTADKVDLFSKAQHVIVSTPSIIIANCFVNKISAYNAFTKRGCVLSIQPYARDRTWDDHLPFLALDTASTPMRSQPVQSGEQPLLKEGTLKRHPAPQRLLSLLEGIDIDVERLVVDLIHRDTELSRRGIIDDLANFVYPNLDFIGRMKARTRAAEGQRS